MKQLIKLEISPLLLLVFYISWIYLEDTAHIYTTCFNYFSVKQLLMLALNVPEWFMPSAHHLLLWHTFVNSNFSINALMNWPFPKGMWKSTHTKWIISHRDIVSAQLNATVQTVSFYPVQIRKKFIPHIFQHYQKGVGNLIMWVVWVLTGMSHTFHAGCMLLFRKHS